MALVSQGAHTPDPTLDYYSRFADTYAAVNHGLASAKKDRETFLWHMKEAGIFPSSNPVRLLDAGSGTGRDTIAFSKAEFQVDAFDGSEAMVAMSSRLTGQPTRLMRFEYLELPSGHYDAVWAMASLLHIKRAALPDVVGKLAEALKPGGLLFAGFKHGSRERTDPHGRHFTDMDEEGIRSLAEKVGGLGLVATYCRLPPKGHASQSPWFSAILGRKGTVATSARDT